MRVVKAAQGKQAGVMAACGPADRAGLPAAAGELAFHKEDMVLAELSKDLVPSRDIVMYPGGRGGGTAVHGERRWRCVCMHACMRLCVYALVGAPHVGVAVDVRGRRRTHVDIRTHKRMRVQACARAWAHMRGHPFRCGQTSICGRLMRGCSDWL